MTSPEEPRRRSRLYEYHLTQEASGNRRPTAKSLWAGFKEGTTAHGIPHVTQARGPVKVTLWLCINVLVLGAMIFHVYSLFYTFLKFRVSVNMQIVNSYNMVFPAVTVCNINPVKSSQLYRSQVLNDLLSGDYTSDRKRKKRQTNGIVHLYGAEKQKSYITSFTNTVADLGADRDQTLSMGIAGDPAWVLDDWTGLRLFLCPGIYNSRYQVLDGGLDAIYKTEHACGKPSPLYGQLNSKSGDACTRYYQVTCDVSRPFLDGSTTKSLHCSASSDQYGGQMDLSVISDCFDAMLLYESCAKIGANYIVTSKMTLDFHWQNRTEMLVITGPSAWLVFDAPYYSTDGEWSSLCPGEYSSGEFFTAATIESVSKIAGALCPNIPAYLNTLVSVDNSTACWVLTYTCDTGYQFSDGAVNHTLVCIGGRSLAVGTWEGNVVTCEAMSTSTEPTTTVSIVTDPVNTSIEYRLPEEDPMSDDFLLGENVIETLSTETQDTKVAMGYQINELILSCTYEGRVCELARDFQHFYDPLLGNCFTYNSGWGNTRQTVTAHRTGQRYGLSLMINVDQSEYTDLLVGPAGARIVLHTQNMMPYPRDLGILAQPGQLLSIGVRQVDMERKSHPYGNCTTDYTGEGKDVFAETYPVEYSSMGCVKTCYQKYLVSRCGCGDPLYPLSGDALDGDFTACASTDIDQVSCLKGVEEEFTSGQLSCDCPQRCSDSFYITDLSTALWPSDKHVEKVLEDLEADNPGFQVDPDFSVRDNLLKLDIYYKEFNLERVIEKPSYVEYQLISDLGGAVGLWFGLSVLSFFEFFELLLDLAVLGCFKGCAKPTTSGTGPPSASRKSPWLPPPPRSPYIPSRQGISRLAPPPYRVGSLGPEVTVTDPDTGTRLEDL